MCHGLWFGEFPALRVSLLFSNVIHTHLVSRHYFLWFCSCVWRGNVTIVVAHWKPTRMHSASSSLPSALSKHSKILWIFIFINSFLRYPLRGMHMYCRKPTSCTLAKTGRWLLYERSEPGTTMYGWPFFTSLRKNIFFALAQKKAFVRYIFAKMKEGSNDAVITENRLCS